MRVRPAVTQALWRIWRRLPEPVKGLVRLWRYGAPSQRQWLRKVMTRDLEALFRSLGPERIDAVEVSGDLWGHFPWKRYTSLGYPDFDLCNPPATVEQQDLVICEQVLEHVENPLAATATLRRLCRPDGQVLVSTPFLVRLHPHPSDYWRFTPEGLAVLLRSQGLEPVWVRSWGNRHVVRANLRRWSLARPWRSLRNDPRLPVMVWALCRPARAANAAPIAAAPLPGG